MKLDIGCGCRKKEGFVGIDYAWSPDVDRVHDVTQGLPFPDNSVDEVYSDHFLEHLAIEDVVQLMSEIHRVCKKEALVEIRVPHFSGFTNFFEYHKTSFRYNSLAEFIEGDIGMFRAPVQFRLISRRLNLLNRQSPKNHSVTKWFIWNYPMEWLVNKFPMFYETSTWRNLFPAWELIFKLRAIKTVL